VLGPFDGPWPGADMTPPTSLNTVPNAKGFEKVDVLSNVESGYTPGFLTSEIGWTHSFFTRKECPQLRYLFLTVPCRPCFDES